MIELIKPPTFPKNSGEIEQISLNPTPAIFNKIKSLKSLYDFKNPNEIQKFLLEHPNLLPIIFIAPQKIKEIFDEKIKLDLELVKDPDEDWECLFITIEVEMHPQIAVELLEELDRKWLLSLDYEILKFLGIDVKPKWFSIGRDI